MDTEFWSEKEPERPTSRWNIILKWVLNKWNGKVWSGFTWLRIGGSSRLK
jgi:hypothetical protein